jgi:uncharacterized protein
MRSDMIRLDGASPGAAFTLTILRFGHGEGPAACIQGGLHADEGPGMLCAHHLRAALADLEREGRVRGEIVLVPAANPIGLSQTLLGHHEGRFQLSDGVNFNRDFPDLADEAASALDGRLGRDAAANVRLVRAALHEALAARTAAGAPVKLANHLKRTLLSEALAADTVLDLHCDGEALNHLYCLPDQAEAFMPLARWLGAAAVLTAEVSGGHPFDEAVSGAWSALRCRFAAHPLPESPLACTVELRGQQDMDHALAAADARAVLNFLALRGHLAMTPDPLPEALCAPTPLAACESIAAPAAGLVVFRRTLGDMIEAGDIVADIVDPVSGVVTPVAAKTSGVFFARPPSRITQPGRRLGKIAGSEPFRTGNLLSP